MLLDESVLQELIKQAGSQRKFAKRLGIGQSTVSAWMTGERNISVRNCFKIAEEFKVKKKYLRSDIFN